MPVENADIQPLPVPPELLPKPAAVAPPLKAYQDELPTPTVVDLTGKPNPTLCRVVLRNKLVQIHCALGRTTPVWSYDVFDEQTGRWLAPDCCLGPTIIVNRKQRVAVTYVNDLRGPLPFRVLQAIIPNSTSIADPLTENAEGDGVGGPAGDATVAPLPNCDALYAWAVTHLHGGRTAAMYDGWTENAMLPPRTEGQPTTEIPGGNQISIYENYQRATMLWYHDHGMGITRFNVLAGLAGAYIIRDPDEDQRLADRGIVLPSGEREIPLVIQDRNLDTDSAGKLNGRLLHKSTTQTAEYFAPYTMVNGVIWPKKSVDRARYRLRLLNGSNARTYCLKVIGRDAKEQLVPLHLNDFVRQIGSDGGLLSAPVTLPDNTPPQPLPGSPVPAHLPPATDGLILASAERADLYVDFGRLPAEVKAVELVNTAFAPFHRNTVDHVNDETLPQGGPVPQGAPGDAQPLMRLPHSEVLQFELGAAPAADPATDLIAPATPPQLCDPADFLPATLADLPAGQDAPKPRLIILVEDPGGMLMMFEMAKSNSTIPQDYGPLLDKPITIVDTSAAATEYVPYATRFEDKVSYFPTYGDWDVWQILNLTNDTHPFHIHLVQFRALQRQPITDPKFVWKPFDAGSPSNPTVTLETPLQVDANEQGWKDTVRVNPAEMLTFAARFDGFSGRYMYHCHILEHEDHEMMRPFVVTPAAVMNVMDGMVMVDGTDVVVMQNMAGGGGMGAIAGS